MNNLVRESLNESNLTNRTLWRNTDEDWLYEFLKNGFIKAKNDRFISLSLDQYSGGMDDFGDVQIEFDEDMIFDQGAIEVFYEPEFFSTHPEISMYVTAYANEEDYYLSELILY